MSSDPRPPVVVAFPALRPAGGGSPWWAGDPRFAGVPAARLPQLLYHVEVTDPAAAVGAADDPPEFLPATPDWLSGLAAVLGVGPRGFRAVARELYPAVGLAGCSDGQAPIPIRFAGRSWSLSLALGLAAAGTGRAIPAWVAASGSLPAADRHDPELTLTATGSLDRKIRLCAGLPPEYEPAAAAAWECGVTDRCHIHGPGSARCRPGRVRLLLLARRTGCSPGSWAGPGTECDGIPEPVRRELGLADAPEVVGEVATKGLVAAMAHLGEGVLLVLQVPTVWHALTVLGIQTPAQGGRGRVSPEDVLGFLLRRSAEPDV